MGIKLKKDVFRRIDLYLFFYDILAVNLSFYIALLLRFDLGLKVIPKEYLDAYLKFVPVYTIFVIIIFMYLHLYSSLWRFAGINELNRILIASIITGIFHTVVITIFIYRMPISYYFIGFILQTLAILVIRFLHRYIIIYMELRTYKDKNITRAMIIGAGVAGQILLKELKRSNKTNTFPCCIIDDDNAKWGRFMEDVPIVGGRFDIGKMVKKYNINTIFFAIPTARHIDRKAILNICKETKCDLKILPGVYELANGDVSLSKMKAVAIEDLLGRDSIKTNTDKVFDYVKNKTVLVTGGGGSIGSELCRQIANHKPKRLIIFDIYENNAYDIEQELKVNFSSLQLVVLIGSVRDLKKILLIFEKYKPDIVYHAAAHKHVPLMETSPNEAIKNNVLGTYNVAYAALKNETDTFVFISTDKAVNPTNVMGASKRICEMIIQSMHLVSMEAKEKILPFLYLDMNILKEDENIKKELALLKEDMRNYNSDKKTSKKTRFVAVRFGNVLGSNGSVIPLFKKQIEAGGPVTVTHPDIIRYFMTIGEAVSLVIEAGAYAKGGEIFVLDMGEPVKIDVLARNLIKLSGNIPDVDIKVEYVGLRPGEKLYEEKLMAEEGLEKTENELIHIGKPVPFEVEEFFDKLESLIVKAYNNEGDIRESIKEIVGTYREMKEKRV